MVMPSASIEANPVLLRAFCRPRRQHQVLSKNRVQKQTHQTGRQTLDLSRSEAFAASI